MMGVSRRFLEGSLALAAGLALTLVGLELGLRLVGALHDLRARRDAGPQEGQDRITVLCVGDSFTWGAGAPASQSWPSQLQGVLDAEAPGTYRVVNRGRGAQNTAQLKASLPALFQEVRPDLLVVLSGTADLWNPTGQWAGGTPPDALRDTLFRVRLYKLGVLAVDNLKARAEQARLDASFQRMAPGRGPVDPPRPVVLARGADLEPSLERWRQAVDARPSEGEGWLGLGETLLALGRVGEAREAFLQGLDHSPTDVRLYLDLARLSADGGQDAAAARWLERAGHAVPDDAAQLAAWLPFFLEKGHHALARRVLARVKARAKDSPDLHMAEATLLEADHDLDGAIQALERASRASPQRSWFHDRLSELYLRAGRSEEARAAAGACLAADARDYHCHKRLVEVSLALGDPEAALRWAQEGAALDPTWMSEMVGAAYEQMGREAEARAWYEKAADLNPELQHLRTRLESRPKAAMAPREPAPGTDDAATSLLGSVGTSLARDLTAIVGLAREQGIQVLFQDYPDHSVSVVLRTVAREQGVRLVSQEAVFAALPDAASFFAPDGHCNARGYGLMARTLAPVVREMTYSQDAEASPGVP